MRKEKSTERQIKIQDQAAPTAIALITTRVSAPLGAWLNEAFVLIDLDKP